MPTSQAGRLRTEECPNSRRAMRPFKATVPVKLAYLWGRAGADLSKKEILPENGKQRAAVCARCPEVEGLVTPHP